MPRLPAQPASLLFAALVPFAACTCGEVPELRIEVGLEAVPFEESCVVSALTIKGITTTGSSHEEATGARLQTLRVPGLEEVSNVRRISEKSSKFGDLLPSTLLTWSSMPEQRLGRLALAYRYKFGRNSQAVQEEIERKFAEVLETVVAECGWADRDRTCSRTDDTSERRALGCLVLPAVLPREATPATPPTVFELAPPEGLAPHVLEALAAGTELRDVPDGTLPGPPRPDREEPAPPPPDYVPPAPYPDEWYGEQQ